MTLLSGLKVVQIGGGPAAAVCGRLLADVGAQVTCIDAGAGTMLLAHLNHGKAVAAEATERRAGLAAAHLIVREGQPKDWTASPYDLAELRRINASAIVVTISPYGETGPRANDPATDLTLFFASGIARLLTGQVDDLSEAPIRPVGEQSAFIGGLAAACAGMHASLGNQSGASIDVSIHEALATLAMTELARAGLGHKSWDRKRLGDGNGATVTILPARDGYAAISPREEKQWTSWLKAMGSPAWGADPRFVSKANRVKNWDALHALMSQWSRQHDKQSIADAAQREHVPSFPLRDVAEHLDTPQMRHRRYYAAARSCRKSHSDAGHAVRPQCRRVGPQTANAERSDAVVRHTRARFQLGDRRSDDDALPGRDGGGGHQGRSARQRRPGARIGTAYGARAGEEEHRPRPEEAASRRDRAGACREVRHPDRKLRHRRHGQARSGRRGAEGREPRSHLYLRIGDGAEPGRTHGPSPMGRCCSATPDLPGSIVIPRSRRASAWRGSIPCAA